MLNNLELVARPEGVHNSFVDKPLDSLTGAKSASDAKAAPPVVANRKFDHSSTLPRASALCDPAQAVVYFIAGAGLIKIGCTTNIVSRFRTIRNSSPVPVELLGAHPGGTLEEGLLHQRFAHLRRHGEWFEDAPEIRAHISRTVHGGGSNPTLRPLSIFGGRA